MAASFPAERGVEIPVGGGGTSVAARVIVQPASPVVVIALHPWGPMGGCMGDRHPVTVCRTMASAGCSTARFDFRSGLGWGGSSISDVEAVAAWFTEPRGDGAPPLATQVLIVGYSYGSLIGAAAAAGIPAAIGYAAINPPLGYGWALYCCNTRDLYAKAADSAGKPKLLMLGTEDQFCSVATFAEFCSSLPEPKTVEVVDGMDHFAAFHELPRALAEWIVASYGVASLQEFARGVQVTAGAPPSRREGAR